jgi:hypothetical protein
MTQIHFSEARHAVPGTSGTGEFFRKRDYADADRDAAPALIAATAQFTSLCGPRATYLVKDLG